MVDQKKLWQELTSPENLWLAYRRAAKGKKRRPDVAKFSMRVEEELLDLRLALLDQSYIPAGYRQFYIHDRKPRLISAAPFRDRVLHHALIQVVEPLFEFEFSNHSWACRKNKGVHGAVQLYQRWAKRYAYALKMDVAGYFHTINHARLIEKLAKIISSPEILSLFEQIIISASGVNGIGIPIGNLTSQVLGNLYLNDLDHFICNELGFKTYLRYVDDMILLADNKADLWQALEAIKQKLQLEGLQLHPQKVYLTPTQKGLDVLGYKVYPRFIQLRHENGYRFRKKYKQQVWAYEHGYQDWSHLKASVQSWIGHAKHANSLGLRKQIFSEIVINRGAAEQAVDSRRGLEQQTFHASCRQPQQERGG